jgi:hypothetical protein
MRELHLPAVWEVGRVSEGPRQCVETNPHWETRKNDAEFVDCISLVLRHFTARRP